MNKFTFAGMVFDVGGLLTVAHQAPAVIYNKGSDRVVILPLDQTIKDRSLKVPLTVMREGVITVIAVSDEKMHEALTGKDQFSARYVNKHLLKKGTTTASKPGQ